MFYKLTRVIISVGFIFTVLIGNAMAQSGTIKGTITNKKTSKAIIGANVYIKSLNKGAVTDENGDFTIKNVPYGTYTLKISYIGYKPKKIKVTVNKKSITVEQSLSSSISKLGNVVVTAYGVKEQENQLTYSAQKVNPEDVASNSTGNVLNSLSGRVAGLQVKQASGIGSSVSTILRGYSSITGSNQALIVVDGVPYINNYPSVNTDYGSFDLGNSGVDINSNNIKSITVLKGPAAAALYGSRASNGAILIQTKKGAPAGERVHVTVKSSGGISLLDGSTIPKYQHKYGAGYVNSFQKIANPFTKVPGDSIIAARYQADASWGPAFDPNKKVYQWDAFYKDSPNYGKPTPWVAAKHGPRYFFGTGVNLDNSLNINGAIGDSSYYSLGYNQKNQWGILPNSRIKNYKLNFKTGYHVNKKLTVTTSANFTKVNGIGRPRRGYDSYMSVIRQFGETNVDYKAQKEAYFRSKQNESWNMTADRTGVLYDNNPYWDRYQNYESDERKHFTGYAKAKYDILSWLSLTARTAIDYNNQFVENRVNVGSAYTSQYTRDRTQTSEFNTDFLLNYNKQITERLSVDGVVGANFRRRHITGINASTNGGLSIPGLYSLANSVSSITYPRSLSDKADLTYY